MLTPVFRKVEWKKVHMPERARLMPSRHQTLRCCRSSCCLRAQSSDINNNDWATHKRACKQRVADLRDEALLKDPPSASYQCLLKFKLYLACTPTITSVSIYDFAIAKEESANMNTEVYYPCCGKCICRGCAFSFSKR